MADERFGASFSIDVTQLKAGLKTANKLIRESQSEFKKAAAGLDDWSKSEKGLKAKIDSLNSIIPKQAEKVRALKEQYQKLVDDGMDEASDRAVELRTKINQEEAALESNRAELEKQQTALRQLEAAGGDAEVAFADLTEQTKKTSGGFTVMKGALANLVADGFRAAIQAAKNFSKELVNVGITFDDSMAQVAAVSGATAEELEQLRAKAKEMGSTTKFTASEAADAFNYMAMAGWKTEQMIGGIDGILNLAAASGADLATTSDIVTDALTAMGYEAKDAGRLADVMAAASSNANTNVEMMGMTFQYAAPIVGALGYSMEDTAKAIGLMANAGIKGEKSGTALRSILTRLSAPPKECADAMTALGFSITDSNGKMKSLDTVMGDLRKAFDGLSETEQTAYAKHIAGAEAMSGLLAIVNAAPADFNKLSQAIENSDGAAQNMANTMLDTLGGDMTVLKSQIEGVRLSIYEKLSPTLRGFVSEAQKAIAKINWKKVGTEANELLIKVADTAKSFAKNVLPTVKKALTIVGKAVKFVVDNFSWLSKTVLIAVTAFKAFKAVMAVTTAITAAKTAIAGLSAGIGIATKVQYAWNAAMAANPIGAVITAVALLVGGIAMLVSKEKEASASEKAFREEIEKTDEQLQANRDSWNSLMDTQQEAVNSGMTQMSYYETLWRELRSITDENGKIQEGYEKRATFIVDTLKEALGIEIELVDGQIKKYGELVDTIDKVIDKKKAQIMLDAQTPAYEEALNNQNAAFAEQIRLKDEIEALDQKLLDSYAAVAEASAAIEAGGLDKKTLKEYQDTLTEATAFIENWNNAGYGYQSSELNRQLKENADLVGKYTFTISQYEKNMALAHEGNWQDMSTVNWDYIKDYKTAEEANRAITEERIAVEEEKLATMKDYNNEMYDDQIAASEATIEALRNNLQSYVSVTETGLNDAKIVWSDSLDDTLSTITGKNIKFQDAGEGLVQMLVDGEKVGAPKSKEEMANMITDTIDEIEKYYPEFKEAGENAIDGVNRGISNEDKQNSVFSKIASFGARLIQKLKSSLQEQSPSKATRKMGRFLLDGLSLGITDNESKVYNHIAKFGKKVVKTMHGQVATLNDAYDFSGLTNDLGNGLSVKGAGSVNNSRTVTVNQYNTYSQAHSRYELYKSKQQTAAAVRLALGTV